jgi:hypothetical protein
MTGQIRELDDTIIALHQARPCFIRVSLFLLFTVLICIVQEIKAVKAANGELAALQQTYNDQVAAFTAQVRRES